MSPDEQKWFTEYEKQKKELLEQNDRVKEKMLQLKQMTEQQVKLKRLMKRNRKVERSIKRRFNDQGMDVEFTSQKCLIPFIIVKFEKPTNPQVEPVEHDGKSRITVNSSAPIECFGDAQVLK